MFRSKLAIVAAGLIAIAVGYLIGTSREKSSLPPGTKESETMAMSAVSLANQCRNATGFDPETSHWSGTYEVAPGIRVRIVPHLESNKHGLGWLVRGRIVAKFVNQSNVEYLPLALPAGGESCLFVQSAQPNDGGAERLTARLIAAGNASMERTVNSFRIDFHPDPHPTPLAHFYNGTRVLAEAEPAGRSLAAAFILAGFVPQDSSGSGGPSAWVTCVTNGCCRFSLVAD